MIGTGSMVHASAMRAGATMLLALFLSCPAAAKPKDVENLEAAGVPALGAAGADSEYSKALIKELSAAQSGKGNNQFCAIIITSDGQLAASPEANELSSLTFGGRPGQAEIVASNSSYTLSIDTPLGFSLAPAGGNDSMVIRTSYSGFGATSFSATPGNVPIRLKRGSTTVSANMVATKTSNLFPAGQYRAELTLRCE